MRKLRFKDLLRYLGNKLPQIPGKMLKTEFFLLKSPKKRLFFNRFTFKNLQIIRKTKVNLTNPPMTVMKNNPALLKIRIKEVRNRFVKTERLALN